jgi:hypothetical protein
MESDLLLSTEIGVDVGNSEETSRYDGSNNYSQKLSTSKPPSASRQRRVTIWEDRLSELADYRKIQGHCNVPKIYKENWAKYGSIPKGALQVAPRRKEIVMTFPRIQELESLGFEWNSHRRLEDRLSELADYRKIHGHCNVPQNYSENTLGSNWVKPKGAITLHLEGKNAYDALPYPGIGELRFRMEPPLHRLGRPFERACRTTAKPRHCNVPQNYSENQSWLGTTQRKITGCTYKERNRLRFPYPGTRKPGF